MLLTLIWKNKSLKYLIKRSTNSTPGRAGSVLTRHKKVPINKSKIRLINTKPFLVNDVAQILRIEYSPKRSAFVGLLRFLKSGFLSYSLIANNAQPGDFIYLNPPIEKISSLGNILLNSNRRASVIAPLHKFPKGTVLSNISARPFEKFSLCLGAGAKAKINAFSSDKTLVEILMPSGKIIYLNSSCFGLSGSASNPSHFLNKKIKAGQSFYKGIRPTVRGVAMNPVDHPMGGGEGKSSGGRPSVSRWGKLTKGGYKTTTNLKLKKFKKIKKLFLK